MRVNKYIYIVALSLLFYHNMLAQTTIKIESIDSGGQTIENGNLKIVYTVGEVAISETLNSNLKISEGFINTGILKTLGIENFEILKNINVYPNPSSDKIEINFPYLSTYEISIFSIQGNEVIVKKYINELSANLDIQHLSNALYFIIIKDNTNKKFVSLKLLKN
jgi:hypothetical protein